MSRADDTRILQMQFDNKDFERDVKTSEKTLHRFKEALDFSKCEKGLEELSKATESLSFSNLVDNVQKLTDKFTGLGTVSELVLSQIRRGIENTARKVSNLVNSLAFDTVGEGKDKFEQMNKNVQSIIAATGRSETDVYKIMERLNQYTDQTSYSFTDMAANVGKFTSVGISLEDAEKQMEGIANWAARSGAGINEASRAMYNLSQAMGVGKMTKIDWKSIENAGMATKEFKQQLIEAAVAAGTLVQSTDKKTGQLVYKTAKNLGKQVEVSYMNVADTLSKGWANRTVMENTLARYYYDDLYYSGENAIKTTKEQKEQLEKLFAKDDKINNKLDWKALESMGLATDEVKQKAIDAAIAQDKLVEAGEKGGKKLYKTAKKYGKEIEFTMDTIEESLSTGWLDKRVAEQIGLIDGLAKASYEAAQKCTTLQDVFQAWKDQLSTGWMKAWQKVFGPLSESMELFSTICNKVGDSFSNFIRTLVGDGEEARGVLGWWEAIGGRDSLWGLFVGEYDGVYEGAYGLVDVIQDVGKIIKRAFWDLMYTLNAGALEAKGITPEQWFENEDYRTWFMGNRFKDATDKIQDFIKRIRDYFNAVPEGETKSRLQKIQDFANGVFSIVAIISNSIQAVFDFIGNLFDEKHLGKPSGLVDSFINILEALGLSVRNVAGETSKGGGLKQFFDTILVTLEPLIEKINTFSNKISVIITKFMQTGREGGRFQKFWDLLVTVFDKLLDVIVKISGPALDFISSILDSINILFTEGLNKESLKKVGKIIYDAFEKLLSDIFGLFPGFSSKIEQFFAYIFGFAEEDASDQADGSGKTILGVIKTWLKKIFGGTSDFLKDAKAEFGNISLFSIIKENLGIGLLGKLISGFSGIVKGTNMYALIMSFLGGYSLIKLIKMLKQGTGLFKAIGNFINNIRNKSLKDIIKEKLGFSKEAEGVTAKLMDIAKAVALIVGAVAVLCLMPINKLKQGLIAFGIIAVVIIGIMFVLQKMGNKVNISKGKNIYKTLMSLGISILAITLGISLLLKALAPMGNMNLGQIASMLTGFAGIILILALFSKYAGSIKGKGVGSLALLAIGIGILVLALKPLANMSTEGLLRMGLSLAGILLILQAFTEGVSSMKGTRMGALLKVAISIWILLEALKPLARYKWEELGKMGAGLVVLLGILTIFTRKVAFMKGSGMGSLVMVAISIFILLESLKPLAKFEWKELAKMGAGLVLLMLILTKFTMGAQSMKSTGMWQLIAVAAALWILVQALMPLAKYKWEELGKMAAGIIVLGVVVVLMSHLTKDVSLLKGGGLAVMLLSLAVVVAAFAFLMGSLSGVSWTNIAAACAGLIAVLVIFAVIAKQMMMMKSKDIAKMLPMFVMLIGLSVVMLAFSVAMNEIKNVDTKKILAFSLGLSAVLIVFATAMKLISGVPIGAAVKGILVMALGLAALMGVIALIAPLVINSISSSLGQMSSQLTLVASLIETFCGRMDGVDEGSIDKGENILNRLKDLAGTLVGFVGFRADVSGFTTALFDLGTGIENFSWHLGQAGDLSNNSAITLIKDLAACANDLDTITKLNIDTLTTKITGLGGAMMLYAQGAREVAGEGRIELNKDDVPDVSAAIALMKEITSGLADEDGLVIPENMPSKDEIGLFGAQLAALAGAMIQFEQAGQGLGVGKDKALEVFDYFVKLKEKLNSTNFVTSYNEVTGSFVTEKIDVNSLTEFGKNIEQLGSALNRFSSLTTRFNEESGELEPVTFDTALDALSSFVDLKTRMPDVGGLAQLIAGHKQSLFDLGAEIDAFGTALQNLSDTLSGNDEKGRKKFDPETTKIVSKAAEDVMEIMTVYNQKLPAIGIAGKFVSGLKSFFVGRPKKISELGEELAEFGKALNSLSHSITGKDERGEKNFDASTMEITKTAVSDMMEIMSIYARKLPTLGRYAVKVSDVQAFFEGRPVQMQELGGQLADFGAALHVLSNNVIGKDENGETKFDPTSISVVRASVSGMIDVLSLLTDEEKGLPKVGGLGQILSTVWNGRELSLKDIGDQMGDMSEGLKKFSLNLKDGKWNTDVGTANALAAIDSIIGIMTKLDSLNVMMRTGDYVNSLNDFLLMVSKPLNELSMFGVYSDSSESLSEAIVHMMSDVSGAFNKYGDINTSKIEAFKNMTEAINYLSSVNPDTNWELIGENIVSGVKAGINKGASGVITAAVDMAVSAYEAAKQALGIESPSRVFMSVGDYAARGLALGINKGSREVEDASENMAENVTKSAQGPLDYLNSLLNSDIDMNPVITPVLDLSNLTAGSETINGLFNNPYGLSLNGGSLSLDPTRATIYADTALPKDYSEPILSIKSEVAELRTDLQNMADAMRQMKFVFHSGAVVAAIGPEMDEYLGQQGYYSVRGEMP